MILSGYGYTASVGETFDKIALVVYGDEKYACDILSVNPTICDKLIFDGGELILLPSIDTGSGDSIALPPWKE